MSQIINKWVFNRQTTDSNEGVGIEIPYIECTYSTRYYVIDTVNGNIIAIHNNKSNQQISLAVLVHLISGSWNLMYAGL